MERKIRKKNNKSKEKEEIYLKKERKKHENILEIHEGKTISLNI